MRLKCGAARNFRDAPYLLSQEAQFRFFGNQPDGMHEPHAGQCVLRKIIPGMRQTILFVRSRFAIRLSIKRRIWLAVSSNGSRNVDERRQGRPATLTKSGAAFTRSSGIRMTRVSLAPFFNKGGSGGSLDTTGLPRNFCIAGPTNSADLTVGPDPSHGFELARWAQVSPMNSCPQLFHLSGTELAKDVLRVPAILTTSYFNPPPKPRVRPS